MIDRDEWISRKICQFVDGIFAIAGMLSVSMGAFSLWLMIGIMAKSNDWRPVLPLLTVFVLGFTLAGEILWEFKKREVLKG